VVKFEKLVKAQYLSESFHTVRFKQSLTLSRPTSNR